MTLYEYQVAKYYEQLLVASLDDPGQHPPTSWPLTLDSIASPSAP